MPPPRLLFVGLDAMDRDVVDQLRREGRLPVLDGLHRESRVVDVENPAGFTSSPVWATVVTGVGPHRHRSWSWRQLRTGTYRLRRAPRRRLGHPALWEELGRHGVRSAVVDVPTIDLEPGFDGIGIAGWSDHDRRDDLVVVPAKRGSLVAPFRTPADDPCDDLPSDQKATQLPPHLRRTARDKACLLHGLLADEPFDLVMAVFGEPHCAGHHLWPRDGPVPADGPLAGVYADVDRALGDVMALAEEGSTVAVLLSHGIRKEATVNHLVDQALRRIDALLGPPAAWHRGVELARRTPNRIRRQVLRTAGRSVEHLDHLADGSRRFWPMSVVPPQSAIRLNVVGREPHGRIPPDEIEDVIEVLAAQLGTLVDAATGRPVLGGLLRTEELYPGGPDDGMPDLLVEWEVDRSPRELRSPTLGTIRGSYGGPRAGGHRRDGRLLLRGPGITPGPGASIRAVDVAPTLADRLDLVLDDVEGSPMRAS